MQILIAEDETDILNLIAEQLSTEDHIVFKARDGLEAWDIIQEQSIDMALLDIMMPKIDGLTLLKKIRKKSDMPVILVTARGQEMDKVTGLSLGADDYLVKPFSLAELSARVAVQVRHLKKNRQTENEKILECGSLVLNRNNGTLLKGEEEIPLNAKEYLLLAFLMENKGKIVTKKQIYQAVWDEDYLYDDNTIMVHLSHIRNKIEDDSKNPKYMVTFRGVGYKFVEPQ